MCVGAGVVCPNVCVCAPGANCNRKRQREINVRLCNETGIYDAIKQTKHKYF